MILKADVEWLRWIIIVENVTGLLVSLGRDMSFWYLLFMITKSACGT